MRKTGTNSKKALTTASNDQQKISRYFNSLSGTSKGKDENKSKTNDTKQNKPPVKNDLDDFDDDFKEIKKEKVRNLKTNKSKVITSPKKETKSNKENLKKSPKIKTISNSPPLIEKQNQQNDSNSEESFLIIDLTDAFDRNAKLHINNGYVEITDKKITSIDSLLSKNDLIKSDRITSPPHSTPLENMKKRKVLSADSPDIIPPTPQDLLKMNKTRRKSNKTKLCKSIERDENEPIIPDRIVKSPPMKRQRSRDSSKNKTVINLSNISANEFDKIHALSVKKSSTKVLDGLESTSNFKVTPVKNITPSKKSPFKGNISTNKTTPSKTKRSLFGNQIEQTNVNQKEQTNGNQIEQTNGNQIEQTNDCQPLSVNITDLINTQTQAKNPAINSKNNGQNEIIEYLELNNISFELDESNYIVTKLPITQKEQEQKDEDNLNDFDFDDNWDEEISNVVEKDELKLNDWTYCRVLEVTKDLQQNLNVKLQSMNDKTETICYMQQIWQNVKLQAGDVINIMAIKCANKEGYFIDNNNGFLVFEPDLMVSPTSIVGSRYCLRRGILQEKFRGFESDNKLMVIGTLVHRLLEEVLRRKFYTTCLIEKKLIEILTSKYMINTLYSSQIPVEELKTELFPFIPKIVNFINKYILSEKNKSKFGNQNNNDDWKGAIHSICDIEENIWCPQLGIKGKVDITVNIDEENKTIVPLELKTGRATMSLEHRGQVIFYIMLMNELGYNVSSGLLLYLREEKLRELSTSHREKRDLLMMRNEFTYYLQKKATLSAVNNVDVNCDNQSVSSKSSITVLSENDPIRKIITPELPEPIDNARSCKMCPYTILCTAYLSRDKSCQLHPKHPLKTISEEVLLHLQPAHIDFFVHWTSLISLETTYKPPVKELKDIWRLEPYKREQRNKSICYLNISEKIYEDNDTYIHTFKRTTDLIYANIISEKNLKTDFLTSGLAAGNYVVLSTDVRVAIATGFIKSITEHNISVALERNLTERYKNKIFHIDTYESAVILNFSMTSVAALLEPTERATRLRELIIDKIPSILSSKFPAETSKIIRSTKAQVIIKRLNKIQQRAVLTALIVKDYLLIKGMPGTGKTATIVALIQLLVMLNKSVLITSHTHSSVDNVCLRLLDSGVEFIRLGAESRIHPQLKHCSESALTADCKSVKDITEVYNKMQVIAVTCLAAGHSLLSQRNIDVCIVDESTQVLQCSVIKALLSTKTFVLIGDPDQLPPVVKNPECVRRGMNESLFERLDNPKSTITLTLQYRMNKTITELANAVTYRGQLLCANDSIGYAILRLPKLERLLTTYGNDQWIISALDPKIENAVIAMDTGPTWCKKIGQTDTDDLLTELQLAPQNATEDEDRKCSNHFECAIVATIIKALKQAGVQSSTIGVIAPYRAQVELLKKTVTKIDAGVNAETVEFEILEDKRRLTVAITRAKHKLIIIGDFVTLKEYSPFNKLISSLQQSQILDLNDKVQSFDWDKICLTADIDG